MDSIKADHGFNMDSRTVKNLLQTMSELTPTQRRDFLQFTTGSPKLPIGGRFDLVPSRLVNLYTNFHRFQKLNPHVHCGLQAQ